VKPYIESRVEMEDILREMTLGFMGLSDDGQPYVVPLNYAYFDGRILFHCALDGKKLDVLRENPRVCFSVARQEGDIRRHAQEDLCHSDCDSVLCYGRARIIEDLPERTTALNAFNRSFRPDAELLTAEDASGCYVVEIAVDEMTGRRERSRELTCWRFPMQS
jgi:nitroimidazol reductase NimA-like FMN-containing flavoprotein (pyridoxamine 5'-phosphate oxidase superfamily)